MTQLVVSFLVSLCVTLFVVFSADKHGRVSADSDLTGPQKFHTRPVPRIGGVGVFLALLAGTVLAHVSGHVARDQLWLLLAASLPAFGSGLAEDLTKNVSARRRLFFTAMSAGLGVWLLDGVLRRTAIPGVDALMVYTPFAIALTMLCVTGVANSINIIDGFNGLASMCVLMMVLGIAYVAFQVHDRFVFSAALLAAGAVLGFFIWNYPAGLIFLGDGGAYLLGFMVSELVVLLLARNPAVSPLFALLLCAYPIFETLFTMYRRRVLKGVPTGLPDGIHLHTLIHRRVVRAAFGRTEEKRQTARNSMTSPYLWLLCLASVIPALLWWNDTAVLTCFLALFIVSYLLMYWSIVRFRVPRWLVIRR
ncbi:MraY family glycosyltransferase [Piscinibacter koreensis]|uniref:Glycosyl transferase n=1 Tax=Piscinibacter koreensis TaxID=2742824 RepID=A0A7Y6NPJ3_9BURK|nr:glycosyltransferase [Schlegelella koreensis]NUZ06983.1 glycosyl transferase [Schlegelella koreensis]